MSAEQDKPTLNFGRVMMAVTNDASTDPKMLRVDSSTGRLLVDAAVTISGLATAIADGDVINAANVGTMVLGTDGSNYQVISVDSTGRAVLGASSQVIGAVTQSGSWSLSANQSVNVAQINGITPLMGNGATGTGSQRVTIASDNTAFSVNAVQSGTWNIGTVTTITNVVHIDDNAGSLTVDYATTGSGTATGALRVELPTNGTGVVGLNAGTNGIGKLTSNSGVIIGAVEQSGTWNVGTVTTVTTVSTVTNLSQMGGVAIALNTGIRSTGTQRVTIATDDIVPASQSGTWNIGTVTTVSTVTNLSQMGGVAIALNTGTRSTGTQRVTIATDDIVPASQSGTWNIGTVTTVTTVSTLTGGGVAHAGADSGNPVKIGGRAINAEITALANNNRSDFVTDLAGKQIVLPYANPENFVSGAITSAMTGTTTTSLLAAPASGLRNYITQITVSNSHATVGTDLIIQDGSGGTTLYTIPAAPAYGGASITFPTL